jgi:pyruvate/2-oxoacid:ferredoxin oxidoreductase alpha subunit
MIKVVTGNEAAAYGALLSRPDVICAYPITPQSRIPELLSEFCAQGLLKGKFINVESEMAAIGYVTGASAGGVRAFTATASQGLAWMHEGLHNAAGSRLPIVMVIANRPLCAPANLTCDQTDSLSQRDTGWLQFYCESNQEILDTVIQAYKISESLSLPSMVCLDGVYLSHVSETVDIPDQEKVDDYLPAYRPQYRFDGYTYKVYADYPKEEVGYRMDRFDDFMKARYLQHQTESMAIETTLSANQEFESLFGRSHLPVEQYKCDDADVVVVMSGSAVGTCRSVIDRLRTHGHKVGLVKLKMFRPFPRELIRNALKSRKKIAVIERDISVGQCGIFYQEIKWALNTNTDHQFVPVYGFIAGLGGLDITPQLIEKAILFTINEDPPQQEILWLGLKDGEIIQEHS